MKKQLKLLKAIFKNTIFSIVSLFSVSATASFTGMRFNGFQWEDEYWDSKNQQWVLMSWNTSYDNYVEIGDTINLHAQWIENDSPVGKCSYFGSYPSTATFKWGAEYDGKRSITFTGAGSVEINASVPSKPGAEDSIRFHVKSSWPTLEIVGVDEVYVGEENVWSVKGYSLGADHWTVSTPLSLEKFKDDGTLKLTFKDAPSGDVVITAAQWISDGWKYATKKIKVKQQRPSLKLNSVVGDNVKYGEMANVSISATASADCQLSYQWYLCSDGITPTTKINEATTDEYSIVNLLNAGLHAYRCVVTATSSAYGSTESVTSVVANVVVTPCEVTLTSGSASKVYDGTALINNNVTVGGDGFVDGEGASYNVTGSQTDVGESENAFTYTLNDGTKASNYNITTVKGKLTVTKASVGGGAGGGEEPGDSEVPQGGVSKFDASCVYDGEGHTIDTNALVAAFGSAIVGASVIEYAVDDGSVSGGVGHAALPWLATAPVYTNAGEYIIWYRVTNPNYNEFTHAAKLSITKRDATLTSGSSSWIYDGVAHSNTAVTATGFVDGEGVTTNNFASIENIGSVANTFDYAFIDGTLAANYNVTCITGTLSVVSAQMDEWTDEAKWTVTLSGNNQKYDGTEKTCEVTAIAYDGFSIPTYTVTGNKGTDAGNYTLTVAGIGNFS